MKEAMDAMTHGDVEGARNSMRMAQNAVETIENFGPAIAASLVAFVAPTTRFGEL